MLCQTWRNSSPHSSSVWSMSWKDQAEFDFQCCWSGVIMTRIYCFLSEPYAQTGTTVSAGSVSSSVLWCSIIILTFRSLVQQVCSLYVRMSYSKSSRFCYRIMHRNIYVQYKLCTLAIDCSAQIWWPDQCYFHCFLTVRRLSKAFGLLPVY